MCISNAGVKATAAVCLLSDMLELKSDTWLITHHAGHTCIDRSSRCRVRWAALRTLSMGLSRASLAAHCARLKTSTVLLRGDCSVACTPPALSSNQTTILTPSQNTWQVQASTLTMHSKPYAFYVGEHAKSISALPLTCNLLSPQRQNGGGSLACRCRLPMPLMTVPLTATSNCWPSW